MTVNAMCTGPRRRQPQVASAVATQRGIGADAQAAVSSSRREPENLDAEERAGRAQLIPRALGQTPTSGRAQRHPESS